MKKIIFLIISVCAAQTALSQSNIDPLEMSVQKMRLTLGAINYLYVDSVNIEKTTEQSIKQMLQNLDPHSSYTNPEETKKVNAPLMRNANGIGLKTVFIHDTLVVSSITPNSSLAKTGVKAGDRIVSANGHGIAGAGVKRETAMSHLNCQQGEKLKLGIIRRGGKKVRYYDVESTTIPVTTIDAYYMTAPGTGYIRIGRFGSTTHDEVVSALTTLKRQNMRNLILDLEGNLGGSFEAAIETVNEFLEKDAPIVRTKGKSVKEETFKSKGGGLFTKGDMAVLIDEYTASAAEVFTGAIQDNDRGCIIGRRSFGKGLVQRVVPFPDGSMISLTVAHYYTPCGRCIQKPFTRGNNRTYNMEVLERFGKGELLNSDKIALPDSLRFKTLHEGRTVYGGGGIMPDIFVPIDTTFFSNYHYRLNTSGVINMTALYYVDANRNMLMSRYPKFKTFMEKYEIPQSLTDELVNNGKRKNIYPENGIIEKNSLKNIETQMKAVIAKYMWGENEYFQIINSTSNVINKAEQYLSKNSNH